MRKILLTALIFLMSVLSFRAYGAEPESEYVRKDVFEAYMQTINTKFDRILSELSSLKSELKAQREELSAFKKDVNNEFAALRNYFDDKLEALRDGFSKDLNNLTKTVAVMAEHMTGLDTRMADVRNDIYLFLVVLGIIFSLPIIKEFFIYFRERKDSRQAVTLEDVKKLIEEAKLGNKTSI